jgi:hypothetical protein
MHPACRFPILDGKDKNNGEAKGNSKRGKIQLLLFTQSGQRTDDTSFSFLTTFLLVD